jgi:hypothetical protein
MELVEFRRSPAADRLEPFAIEQVDHERTDLAIVFDYGDAAAFHGLE